MTEEQRAIVREFALLEKNTPGTIEGLADFQRQKTESGTGAEKSTTSEDKSEHKSDEKPGILTRIKNAIFG